MVSLPFIPLHDLSIFIKKLEQKATLVMTRILQAGMSFGNRSLGNQGGDGDRRLVKDGRSWPFLCKSHY